jgi:uncharacterized Zn-finger protein
LESGRFPEMCVIRHSVSGVKWSHINAYSGERPFFWNVCNMAFSRQNVLKTHQRIHSGERPYCCYV